MERIDKIISESSLYSRKDVKTLIKQGRVFVNDQAVKSFSLKIEDDALITVDGIEIERKKRIVAVLYKKKGYVTSTEDPTSPTVMELVPPFWQKAEVFPVGRLDKDTEGLLLFTNDGDLAHRLLSPKHNVEKEYLAEHTGSVTEDDIKAFEKGIILQDGTVCRSSLLVPVDEGKSLITITEGKYHQVRRMMASRGLKVTALKRIREGGLTLDNLECGKWRELSKQEEALLFLEK